MRAGELNPRRERRRPGRTAPSGAVPPAASNTYDPRPVPPTGHRAAAPRTGRLGVYAYAPPVQHPLLIPVRRGLLRPRLEKQPWWGNPDPTSKSIAPFEQGDFPWPIQI